MHRAATAFGATMAMLAVVFAVTAMASMTVFACFAAAHDQPRSCCLDGEEYSVIDSYSAKN
jgi:hypothetical protein